MDLKKYKYIFSVETYDILTETQNWVLFERLTQQFYTIFDYSFQERSKIKLFNPTSSKVNMVSSLIKNIISLRMSLINIWEQKQKRK